MNSTAAPLKVQVPVNTMLADLDESLKSLLKRDLERHGFDGVEIVFDAPDKEWAASLSSPAVNLFLYDIREAKDLRPIEWQEQVREGRTIDLRPPLRIDASYAVTAWTRDVQDEHRLLSQTMAIFYAFPTLPQDILAASLANGSQRFPLKTATAQERHEDASDFWTAVGGQYKASFNYVVTLSCEAGVSLERGPEVKTATTRLFDRDSRNATLIETHRSGGTVVDADGAGVRDVWVRLLETGQISVTDGDGRFRFDRLHDGKYTVQARGADGRETKAALEIPGQGTEIVLGAAAPAKSR
ncbi:MAG TPA: Pvc16 family protein [Gaiellaceae bacterium]|nr:Pvc16 family protein [Gaiellaceae bacterium]